MGRRSQRNFVPALIAEGDARGAEKGVVRASVLAADVVGFTALTERLRAQGERGTERLGNILTGAHAVIGQAVAEQGGSVVAISGDGILALFAGDTGSRAASAAFSVRAALSAGVEGQSLQLRCGLAEGDVEWRVYRAGARAAFGLEGGAILRASRAENQASMGEIVADAALAATIPDVFGLSDSTGFATLIEQPIRPGPEIPTQTVKFRAELNASLMPFDLSDSGDSGEFREVISAFIRLRDGITPEEKQRIVETLLKLSAAQGGTGWRLEQGASGVTFFMFWGAPVAHEHDLQRAFGVLRPLIEQASRNVSIGASLGRTFAGFVGTDRFGEYACLGASTNLAARLAHRAPPGEFWIEPNLATRLNGRAPLREIGALKFKGFNGEVAVRAVTGDFNSKAESARTRLVGRDELRALLVEKFSGLADGSPVGGIILQGEPGIGKSHLAEDVVQGLPDGIAYFRADTNPVLRPSLGAAWDVLRQAVPHRRALMALCVGTKSPALRATLERTAPVLAAGLGFEWSQPVDPKLDAETMLRLRRQGIAAALRGVAEDRPLLLHVEDIHWLDNDSRDVLSSVLRSLSTEATATTIGILMTARPRDQHLPPDTNVSIHTLERLDTAAISELLSAQLGGSASQRLVSVVEERSSGVALFVTQLARYLQDASLLERVKGIWHLTDRFEAQRLPTDARALLTSRIDRLPEEARRTVAIAAVLEGAVNPGQVGDLAAEDGVSLSAPEAALKAAVTAHILTKTEGGYRFSHALLRDAAYEMILPSRRVHLHRLAARLLKTAGAGPAVLALHFDRGELTIEAVEHHLRAAREADEAYQNEAAIWHNGRALDLLPEKEHRTRFETAVALEQVLARTSDHTRQEKLLEIIEDLAAQLTEKEVLVAGLVRAEYLNYRSQHLEAIATLEPLMNVAERHPGSRLCVRYHQTLALAYNYSDTADHNKNGLIYAKAAVSHARASGDTELLAEAKSNEAAFYRYRDDPKADALYREALELVSDPVLKSGILHRIGSITFRNGDREQGYDLYDRAMEIAEKTGDMDRKGSLALGYALQAERQGHLATAISLYQDVVTIGQELNTSTIVWESKSSLASLVAKAGRLGEADDMIRELVEEKGPVAALAEGTLAWHFLLRMEHEEAEALFSRYVAWLQEMNYQASMLSVWEYRITMRVLQGDFSGAQDMMPTMVAAAEIFESSEAYGQSMDRPSQLRVHEIVKTSLAGHIELALGRVEKARELADRAVRVLSSFGNSVAILDVQVSGVSPGSYVYALAHDLLARLGHPRADEVLVELHRRMNDLADRFEAAGYSREGLWKEDRYRAYLMERAPGQPGRTLADRQSD